MIKKPLLLTILLLGSIVVQAQDNKTLSLKDAITIALSKSHEIILANSKVETAKLELETVKNNLYPSLRLTGQYLRLNAANVEGALLGGQNSQNSSSSGGAKPDINSLLLGQANFSMPLFGGFRLQNNINLADNSLKVQKAQNLFTKEQIALRVVELFAQLYQANQTVQLFTDNLLATNQRVKDFSALVDNGLLARNDLLKSQLQSSKIQLLLDAAAKNVAVINFQLVSLLQFSEKTIITIDIETIKNEMLLTQKQTLLGLRNDMEALTFQQKVAETGVKLSKSKYYPNVNLVAGYIGLDLKNALQVSNAMNVGIGVSYDVTSVFKNNKEVKLAQSKTNQVKESIAILSDKIKEETQIANENYKLSVKQNSVYNLAVEQATENFRIVQDKYDNGLSNTNDLIEADVEQLQSKINLSLSQADIALKFYQLQFASGNLLNSFNLNSK